MTCIRVTMGKGQHARVGFISLKRVKGGGGYFGVHLFRV